MDTKLFENGITGIIIDDGSKLSAVSIPIIDVDGKLHILFEKRSSKLPDQPGDVCLPGGMLEEGELPKDAMIRETIEELCITEDQIEMIGPVHLLHTSNLTIFPFVVKLKEYNYSHNEESSEVFTVPLEFFKNTVPEFHPLEWNIKESDTFPYDRIVGGKNYKWRKHVITELFYDYKGITIWGLTAKVIYYALVKFAVDKYKL